ncbi:FtsX-like permease family protein [Fulvivirga sp. RKSG066]|uniref:ABC transporter permease n=1 Tax=Fulvivirga aurantia TaxID=2529383 RepID=UPI0012BC566A|nr:ABC transporter permease [Fulvivirga aurantia]MTI21868.1 FtsX-like permease family protein [Fulvivirga aurantia]
MLKNYFKIALRNMLRNKAYAFINILGLTLGITCCSLLFLFVINETSYDKQYQNSERIYRVVEISGAGDDTRYFGQTTPALAPTMVEEFEEVEKYSRLFKFGGHVNFSIEETKYAERDYYFANPEFLEMFDVEWLKGDKTSALNEPGSMVIDEDWAKTLFGNEEAMGKEIIIDGDKTHVVTGIIKKFPKNTHLDVRILVSYPGSEDWFKEYLANWGTYGAYVYFQLAKHTRLNQVEAKIPGLIEKYFKPEDNRNFYLQPLTDIHFNSKDIEFGADNAKGEEAYIYIFIAVGALMLLIACINYMNLATAKSLHRGKEIGMRKVSGAQRYQLIVQFLTESTVMALIALILSVGLVDLLLPYFNELTNKAFEFNADTFLGIFSLLFAITLVVGVVSGLYPAFLMSKLKPANILKGSLTTGRGSILLRKTLVITQFTLSIIMIVATIVASNQMSYVQEKSLGFDKDHMMVIDINSGAVRQRAETMANEFLKSPYVTKVGISSRVPGEWKNLQQLYVNAANDPDSLRTNFIGFDVNMIDTYEIDIVDGKGFSGNAQSDSLTILVNEALVEELDLKSPVGDYLTIQGGRFQITGVLKNFNFQSLHSEIAPLIVGAWNNPFQQIDYFSLKYDPDHIEEAVAHATSVHDQFDEYTPIEYHFLDQQWDLFYENDKRAGNVFALGAGITIFIACMGLFGLASYIIQKRTKEISVRKVLGASVRDLFMLLSKTFVVQVFIAFIIAVPIAWYMMNAWLDNFAYRFNLGVSEFLIGGISALLISMISISYKVLKAAYLNPAGTLKED